MAIEVRNYDPNRLVMNFAGIIIDSGYADGTFLSIEQGADDYSVKVGADGEVVRTKMNNATATVTFTLQQTSVANTALAALRTLGRATSNGADVGPLFIQDLNGAALYTASKAWIVGPPGVEFGQESTNREWRILAADLVRLDGGAL